MLLNSAYDFSVLDSASDDLSDKLTTFKLVVWVQLNVYNVLLTFGIIYVLVAICRKGSFKYMPFPLKLSLILFLTATVNYFLINTLYNQTFGPKIIGKEIY